MGISFFSSIKFSPEYLEDMSKRGKSTLLENMVECVDDFCASIGCIIKHAQVVAVDEQGLVFKSNSAAPLAWLREESHSSFKRTLRVLAFLLIIPLILVLVVKLVLRLALFFKYGFTAIERIEVVGEISGKPKTPITVPKTPPGIIRKPVIPPVISLIKRQPLLDVEIEKKYLMLQLKETDKESMYEIFSLLLYGCEESVLTQLEISTYGDVGIHKRFSFRINRGNLKNILFTYVPGSYVPPGGIVGVPIWLGSFRTVDLATFKFYADKCLETTMAHIDLVGMRERGVKTVQERINQLGVIELSEEQFQQLRRDCRSHPARLPICSLEEVPCYHNGELVGHAGIIAQELPKEES
ncbi:hypothetical protein O1W69_05010 [Chlamydia sp. 12-01]|uniref:hypothetical protein n=1 Tax=Chlamydia sp. 12-01 TaxID=3002742 RepID=UPI0035D4AEE2